MGRLSTLLIAIAAMAALTSAIDVFTGELLCYEGGMECIDETELMFNGTFAIDEALALRVNASGLAPGVEVTIKFNCANSDGTVRATEEVIVSTDEDGSVVAMGEAGNSFDGLTTCNAPFLVLDGMNVHCLNAFKLPV